VKLSRPPIPLGDPDGLAAAVTLAERAPYSGMEYGYYHGVVAPEFAPALSVDVLYPGCLTGETDEVRGKSLKVDFWISFNISSCLSSRCCDSPVLPPATLLLPLLTAYPMNDARM
jgi:hypothetical protein